MADSTGEVVSTAVVNAVATRSNPAAGPLDDDPNDKGQVYNLSLLLPAAGHYTISTSYDANATIYRSNGGVTGYPFKIGDVFSIQGNTATSASDTAYYKNFYYYLYDIHLLSPGCASAAKQSVSLVKPVITQNGNILSSNFTSNNQWYLNDVAISGATGQTYAAAQSGNYRVDILLSNGCVSQSDNFVYVNTSISPDNDIGLAVFPVPADDQLNVVFAAPAASALTMSLVNSAGHTNYSEQRQLSPGNFSTVINTGNLTPGTYILKILLGNKKYARKIIIDR